LIAIGRGGRLIAQAAGNCGLEQSTAVESTSAAAQLLTGIAAPGDLILVKGSRAARTEQVIEQFAAHEPAGGVAR
jgi:UDP-N-acetylmuramyl pentapeptide synthase